jgi:tryptophanyl-tRNA synthetase
MSKSYNNTIGLFEEEKALRKKVMSIVTDSLPVAAPKDPAASSIVALYKLVASAEQVTQMESDFRAGGTGYGDFKKRLFEGIWERFAPFRARRAELAADPATLDAILADGARRARAVALPTMERVRKAMGFGT